MHVSDVALFYLGDVKDRTCNAKYEWSLPARNCRGEENMYHVCWVGISSVLLVTEFYKNCGYKWWKDGECLPPATLPEVGRMTKSSFLNLWHITTSSVQRTTWTNRCQLLLDHRLTSLASCVSKHSLIYSFLEASDNFVFSAELGVINLLFPVTRLNSHLTLAWDMVSWVSFLVFKRILSFPAFHRTFKFI